MAFVLFQLMCWSKTMSVALSNSFNTRVIAWSLIIHEISINSGLLWIQTDHAPVAVYNTLSIEIKLHLVYFENDSKHINLSKWREIFLLSFLYFYYPPPTFNSLFSGFVFLTISFRVALIYNFNTFVLVFLFCSLQFFYNLFEFFPLQNFLFYLYFFIFVIEDIKMQVYLKT